MYTGIPGEIGEIIPIQSSEEGVTSVLSKVSFTEVIQMLYKSSSILLSLDVPSQFHLS